MWSLQISAVVLQDRETCSRCGHRRAFWGSQEVQDKADRLSPLPTFELDLSLLPSLPYVIACSSTVVLLQCYIIYGLLPLYTSLGNLFTVVRACARVIISPHWYNLFIIMCIVTIVSLVYYADLTMVEGRLFLTLMCTLLMFDKNRVENLDVHSRTYVYRYHNLVHYVAIDFAIVRKQLRLANWQSTLCSVCIVRRETHGDYAFLKTE